MKRVKTVMKAFALAIAVGAALSAPAFAADVQSVSRLAFGPGNILFVADWKAAQILALQLPPSPTRNDSTFNSLELSGHIRTAIKSDSFRGYGCAAGNRRGYLAVSYGADRKPAILVVTADRKTSPR